MSMHDDASLSQSIENSTIGFNDLESLGLFSCLKIETSNSGDTKSSEMQGNMQVVVV